MVMNTVIDVEAAGWEREVVNSDMLTVVDFWHDRCVWCKRLDPIYSELSGEYEGKVKFAKLNVLKGHENQEIGAKYGVMGTPTLIFFCDGRPIETAVGFQPKERLKQLVDDVLVKYRECIEKSTELKP